MAENSAIEWTDHTFNPWIGCTKISPACDNCYAEELMDHRLGRAEWGAGKPRVLTTDHNWKVPLRWNRKAGEAGIRQKVFCASLADVFDAEVPDDWRDRLFELIDRTRYLDWLLLTKRPTVALRYLRHRFGSHAYSHRLITRQVWIGATAEDQATYEARIGDVSEIKALGYTTFLSCEPLLGRILLRYQEQYRVDWVIAGGESGRNFRPMNPNHALELKAQCAKRGISFFMKQMSGNTKAARQDIPPELLLREFPA